VAEFLAAAAIQRDNPDCEVMFVSESPVDPTVVYVTEVWTSEEAWERRLAAHRSAPGPKGCRR
jgi:quinol monooxygenase YgiN